MSYSLSEIENRLYEVMEEAGCPPAPGQRIEIVSGRTYRYQISGDRQGTKNGAFCVYVDERPAGWLQNWKSGDKLTFTMRDLPALDAEQKERFRQEMEQARVKRAEETVAEHARVASQARQQWKEATAADPAHTYLTKKGVPGYTLKQSGDTLLVPLYDKDSQKIINLQRIWPSGEKRPLTGGRMKGVFSPIGKNPNGPILVCEGWATGATLHKLTGYTVICAMNTNNLADITRMAKLAKEDREVLICADNDHKTERETGKNPGKAYANKAAEMAKLGAPIWPDFQPEEDGSDWNDYMLLHGESAAKAHFEQKYKEAHASFEPPAATIAMDKALFPDINARSNKPLGTIENIEALLRYYKIGVRYNEVTKTQEITIPASARRVASDSQLESDMNRICSLAARHEIPQGKIPNYVDVIADANSYNPVRDWIGSKSWDGIPRWGEFLNTLTIQEGFPVDVAHLLIRKWMLSAVAAVFKEEGFWTRGVLVLQGEQGIGKTSWFRHLAPENSGWIGDGKALNPQEKDSVLGCICYWITELGELEGTFKKADMARLKAFLTQREDNVRVPYARKQSIFRRRTIFCASVNQFEFLSDSTGTSRWWCIPVEKVNTQHCMDIQQIWAEVLTRYEDGAEWWLTYDEENALKRTNWEFESVDHVADLILKKFDWTSYPDCYTSEMSATDVLKICGIDMPKKQEAMSAAATLRQLTKKKPRKDRRGQRLYTVPPTLEL